MLRAGAADHAPPDRRLSIVAPASSRFLMPRLLILSVPQARRPDRASRAPPTMATITMPTIRFPDMIFLSIVHRQRHRRRSLARPQGPPLKEPQAGANVPRRP